MFKTKATALIWLTDKNREDLSRRFPWISTLNLVEMRKYLTDFPKYISSKRNSFRLTSTCQLNAIYQCPNLPPEILMIRSWFPCLTEKFAVRLQGNLFIQIIKLWNPFSAIDFVLHYAARPIQWIHPTPSQVKRECSEGAKRAVPKWPCIAAQTAAETVTTSAGSNPVTKHSQS